MIRRIVREEVTRVAALDQQIMRRTAREEAARAIESLPSPSVRDGELRRIAREEATAIGAAEAARALEGVVGAAVERDDAPMTCQECCVGEVSGRPRGRWRA